MWISSTHNIQVLILISKAIYLCQLNNLSEKENSNSESLPDCKYRDVSYFSNFDAKLKMEYLSFFYLNIKFIQNMKIFRYQYTKPIIEFLWQLQLTELRNWGSS